MSDPAAFRQFMSCFATGITVVTTRDAQGKDVGITINSFTSVSLAPPLVLFCLVKTAHLYPVFRKAEFFAVNILSAAQENISRHFAAPLRYPASKKIWDKPHPKCPVLRQTLGWMVCRKIKTYKGGDHDIFLGEVEQFQKSRTNRDPLLYFHSHYRKMGK